MKYPKRCQYKHAKQKKYHVRNWAEYNEGLRRRGDLTVWFDEEAIANWKADKTGEPGGQRVYSDMAIETGLVVRIWVRDTQQDGCARDARYVLRRVTLQPAQGGQRFAPGRATTPGGDESANKRRNQAGMVPADRRLIKFGAPG